MPAYSDRMNKHAERLLTLADGSAPKDSIEVYRKFFEQEETRLRQVHQNGEDGLALARRRSAMVDAALTHLWKSALKSMQKQHGKKLAEGELALLAVGGFGRQELSPYSDIDLLFLCGSKKAKASPLLRDVIEQILYVLWDTGFKVGHATRTLSEMVQEANENWQTKTAILDMRLIAGTKKFFHEAQRVFQKRCLHKKEEAYLQWRLEDQAIRHRKHNNTPFLQEPNVKTGCGGLRDYHNLLWVARVRAGAASTEELREKGWLSKAEERQIDRAYRFLLRVRHEMHYQRGRPEENLTLKLEGEVATALGYTQRHMARRAEAFMKDYFGAARDLFQLTNLCAKRLIGELKRNGKKRKNDERIDGFLLSNGELNAESNRIFHGDDPVKILRVFQILQKHDAQLSPELEMLIRSKADIVNQRTLWMDEAREMFKDILRKKGRVGKIIRALHETGVLGRLIPEFAPLTCLVQHEFFHIYTADEHTLVCLEQLDKVLDCPDKPFSSYRDLFVRCDRPEIVYLALILHDVGKGTKTPHHHEASAQLATRFARRMKFHARRFQNLVFLVYHHGTLSEFAQRRNLEELETIREFARIVQDQERLDMLMLVTFADAQGVNMGASTNWSSWKELLVWKLYRQTSEILQGEEEFLRRLETKRQEIVQNVRKLVDRKTPGEEVDSHFSLLPSGYLNANSEVLMARHIERVHHFLTRQMSEDPETMLKPSVKWIHKENESHSEVIVVTWDREHLFSWITGAFALADLNILSADVSTRRDNIVVDTFRVCTERSEPATHPMEHRIFEETLTESLSQDGFDFKRALAQKRAETKAKRLSRVAEFPTRIVLDNETSRAHTLLHIETPDRIGLLFDITSCVSDFGLTICHSRITTEKGAALDTFYVSPRQAGGAPTGKVADEVLLEELREALKRTIVGETAHG